PRPPISTLFPYTTLFRSNYEWRGASKVSYVKKVVKGDKTYIIGAGYYPHSKESSVENLVKGAADLFNTTIKNNRSKEEVFSAIRSEEHTSELQSLAYLVC